MKAAHYAQALNTIQAIIAWLVGRGLSRSRIQAILDNAGNDDVTTEQVQAEIDALGGELQDTEDLINGT